MTSNELYKINNDISNIKNDIVKTIKKEDGIRFRIFKDAIEDKHSFPYYYRKYEDYIINNKNDDIENDKVKSIAEHMNIGDSNNYYYVVSLYLEIFNEDCEKIVDIRRERRLLEVKYDEMIKIKEELEIEIINNNSKKEFIKKVIMIIIIYLISTTVYIQWTMKK
jgi:hypothetical protein